MKKIVFIILYTISVLAVGAFLYWFIAKNFSHPVPRENAKKEVLLKRSLDSITGLLRKSRLRDSSLVYQLEIMREKQRTALKDAIIYKAQYELLKNTPVKRFDDHQLDSILATIR